MTQNSSDCGISRPLSHDAKPPVISSYSPVPGGGQARESSAHKNKTSITKAHTGDSSPSSCLIDSASPQSEAGRVDAPSSVCEGSRRERLAIDSVVVVSSTNRGHHKRATGRLQVRHLLGDFLHPSQHDDASFVERDLNVNDTLQYGS